jgi:hypothetical protein
LDPRRLGLPAPTIAVGTIGGCTIFDANRLAKNSSSTAAYTNVAFEDDGTLVANRGGTIERVKPSAYLAGSWSGNTYTTSAAPAVLGTAVAMAVRRRPGGFDDALLGSTSGLTLLAHDVVAANGMAAQVTDTFATGWMPGAVKLALAESSADVSSLVGATPLSDDFSSYADDAALNAAWTVGGGATAVLNGGAMRVTRGAATGWAHRSFTTIVGRRYRVRYAIAAVGAGAGGSIRVGTSANNNNNLNGAILGVGSYSATFVATATTTFLSVLPGSANGDQVDFDTIIVDLAAEDRSIAGNHAIVNGTVTRAVVATGAELASYGGFSSGSSGNCLEAPANSALDFGTGDFSVSAWVYRTVDTGFDPIFCYGTGSNDGTGGYELRVEPAGTGFRFYYGSTALVGSTSIPAGMWHHIVGVCRSGVIEGWLNGVRIGAGAVSGQTATKVGATLRIGNAANNTAGIGSGSGRFQGQVALPRVSAIAPTQAQIQRMYADEAPLFQPNAKCLLSGSPSVLSIAADPETDEAEIGTAAGTNRFKGLQRIGMVNVAGVADAAKLSNDNHKAVAASDGDLFIASNAEVYGALKAIAQRERIRWDKPARAYDPTRLIAAPRLTSDATPTVIKRLPVEEGERFAFDLLIQAHGDRDGSSYALYRVTGEAYRPAGGNVALRGTPTVAALGESTGTMDLTVAADTTNQTINFTATGVASTNIVWSDEGVKRAAA